MGRALRLGWFAVVSLSFLNIVYGQQKRWEPVGLSGGGAMFTPAISPADPKEMMLNCDMSGAYISRDGGAYWKMINHLQLRSNTQCRPAFHPMDSATIFAANAWSGLAVSHDHGDHWSPIGGIKGSLLGDIVIDESNPDNMIVGTDKDVVLSTDEGKTFTSCDEISGTYLTAHFDQTSPLNLRVCYIATTNGVWRSDDAGRTWKPKVGGLSDLRLKSFSAGSNHVKNEVILYCTVAVQVINGRLSGGLYKSTDRGETWVSAMGNGLNSDTTAFDQWSMGSVAQYPHIITNNANPSQVYVCNTNTGIPPPHHASVYRSKDAGRNWKPTFQGDPRFPDCNVERDYTVAVDGQFYQDVPNISVASTDPNRLVIVNGGTCYTTQDAGEHWACGHSRPASAFGHDAPQWDCNGLVVTTTWNYYVDPFDPKRHFICYTDIGFARSTDSGHSWEWWSQRGRAPWTNTCYELAFDPKSPGRVWGAFSNVHDIPNGNIIWGSHRATGTGGICKSDDHGATWKKCNDGLPITPATSIALDTHSGIENRTLFAGFFGEGVFRSDNGGVTWSEKNTGLGSPTNRRVSRVLVHPDGTVFALITAHQESRNFLNDGAGIYRSRDRGEHWVKVTESRSLLWPKDITVDPLDSRVIYVGASDARQGQAGLWKTRDGGDHWTMIFQAGPEHFGGYLHPNHPGWVYATLTEGAPKAGLWLSKDGGQSWKSISALPFSNIQRVVVDPRDPGTIFVTTFGGSIWKGPADPGDE